VQGLNGAGLTYNEETPVDYMGLWGPRVTVASAEDPTERPLITVMVGGSFDCESFDDYDDTKYQYLVHPSTGCPAKWQTRAALISDIGGGGSADPTGADLGISTTCDIYSPFGGSLSDEDVPCVIFDDLFNGRGTSPLNTVCWTHIIDVAQEVSVLDGCTRTSALNTQNYADGDEIRIPTGGAARYVVCWVTLYESDSGVIQRCFCMRHSA
jgi:hypothetical protein